MSLCLIAGQGVLPGQLLRAFEAGGLPVHLAALEGAEAGSVADRPVHRFRLETLGSFLNDLRGRGIDRVCLAGGIRRPRIDPEAVDAATTPLVPRLGQALAAGDDGALRIVLDIFAEAGLAPVAPHEVLPDLLPPAGLLAGEIPDGVPEDAARAATVVAALGVADLGQGCVVASGQVLAVEAAPGTDWMLGTLAAARGSGPLGRSLPEGGLLLKAPKPDQDRRIDLPAIGPDTVSQAAAAGLAGIVIEAGGVMVLDRAELVRLVERHGLFLWVRAP